MKALAICLAAVFGLIVVVVGIGYLRPAEHVASTRARFDRSPYEVWDVVSDLERLGEWSSEIERMERRPEVDGEERWLAFGTWGRMPMAVETFEPPGLLVTRAGGSELAFEGIWTHAIEADGEDGAVLTITERGRVQNPLLRFFALFKDPHDSARTYLHDLATRLETTVEPVDLP